MLDMYQSIYTFIVCILEALRFLYVYMATNEDVSDFSPC